MASQRLLVYKSNKRALRRHTTWHKARKAQRAHLSIVHPDGVLDCVCERSVWYFAKRKSLGHHQHCEMCHPRYRNGNVRSRLKRFIAATDHETKPSGEF